MSIQTDFEARFATAVPPILWVEAIASTWPAYTCLQYDDNPKNREAILNLIAFLLTNAAAPGSGSARNVASKSVGSVSVSYEASASQSSNLASWFNSNRYGQTYWILSGGRRTGARFV